VSGGLSSERRAEADRIVRAWANVTVLGGEGEAYKHAAFHAACLLRDALTEVDRLEARCTQLEEVARLAGNVLHHPDLADALAALDPPGGTDGT
jgi:hypothetical protein